MWVLLLIFCISSSLANAAIKLPSDLITTDKICNEYRSILNLKIQEMRRTFTLKEVHPGEIHFLDSDLNSQAILRFFHSMNPEKTKKIEKVRITNSNAQSLIEEETITRGKNLSYADSGDLIFFESDGSHCTLSSDETQKEVKVTVSDSPIFKLLVQRHISTQESIIRTQIFMGVTHVITTKEITSNDSTKKRFEYIIHEIEFVISGPGFNFRMRSSQPGNLWLTSTQDSGFLLPNFKYYSPFKSSRGLRGDLSLNEFLNETNDRIYLPFIKHGLLQPLEMMTAYLWPKTERTANVAVSNRFLDELHLLRQRVDEAQTNPSLLIQIKSKLLEFIGAIQDGSLQVNDNRK